MLQEQTIRIIENVLSSGLVVSSPISLRWFVQNPYPGSGVRKSRAKGSMGYDVAGLYEYEPGDPIVDIDWAASALTNFQPVMVRRKLEPRELQVYLLVDVGPTMSFGTIRTTKRMLAVELAASIIKSAAKTEDKIGMITYSDQVESATAPRSAKSAMVPLLAQLIESPGGAKTSTSSLARALERLPQRRSLVIVLSDFLNLSQEDKEMLAHCPHECICLPLSDRRERELPEGFRLGGINFGGIYLLSDMLTGRLKAVWLSETNRRQYAADFARHQETLDRLFDDCHVTAQTFSTEEGLSAVEKTVQLFRGLR